MIRIVTVEREYGAGGSAIAQKLAGRLNWKLWDQTLTAKIARMARCDRGSVARMEERIDPLFYRLMKVFMRGSYERSLPVGGLEHLDADSMAVFMQRVIEGAAAAGNCVIVGRGAPYVLRGRPDAFHVFVYAPLEEKIRRVRDLGKTEAEAADLAEAVRLLRALTGTAPAGWYTGRDSPNTRSLVVAHGGFLYDADSYGDDLPYWTRVDGHEHLVVPYTMDTNDMRFASPGGFSTGVEFESYVRDAFDVLLAEGRRGQPKMLSIGLHGRVIGRPGRLAGLLRVLAHMRAQPDVWFAQRVDIARHWIAEHPPRA